MAAGGGFNALGDVTLSESGGTNPSTFAYRPKFKSGAFDCRGSRGFATVLGGLRSIRAVSHAFGVRLPSAFAEPRLLRAVHLVRPNNI